MEDDGSEIFISNQGIGEMMDIMNDLRKEGKHCDLIIISSDGIRYPVHRIVLVARSPYFYRMLNAIPQKIQNLLHECEFDSHILSEIINYMYNGIIAINKANSQEIYTVATIFELDFLVETCVSYFKTNMDYDDCVDIYQLAVSYKRNDLSLYCQDYMVEHFEEFILRNSYLKLSFNEFRDIITHERSQEVSELNLYTSIINWVKHALQVRKYYFVELTSYINLPTFGEVIALQEIIDTPDDCNADRIEVSLMEYVHNQLYTKYYKDCDAEDQQPQSLNFSNVLFAPSDKSDHECSMYYLPNWTSTTVPPLKYKRICANTVYAKGKFFVLGGINNQNMGVPYGECFSIFINRWMPIDHMPRPRYDFGGCYLDELIYVCGGYDNRVTSDVQIYNMGTGLWTTGQPMKFFGFTRSGVIGNAIYCFGETKAGRLDPRENKWESVNYMDSRCEKFCLISDNNVYLYRIGTKETDRFDIRNGTWETLCQRDTYRSDYGAVKFDQNIYIFGGQNMAKENVPTVEVYDIPTNEWSINESVYINYPNAFSAALYST